ncbi:MAG: hypothetical protein ACRCXC_08290 [Legionella sp.]
MVYQKNAKGKETLHYQSAQTEEVTPLIHSLHVTKQYVRNKQFLQLTLAVEG